MFLEKTLLLKGVAGVATVGGVVGGGFVINHLSKKEAEGDTDNTDNNQDHQATQTDQVADGGKEPQDRVDNVASQQTQDHGAGGDGAVVGPEGGAKVPSGPSAEEIAQQKEVKKTEINGKLDALGLGDCHLEISDLSSSTVFSKDCELDEAKLKLINFSNKGTEDVTVTGLNGGNVKLNIANKEGGDSGIKYTFKDVNSKLTISGDSEKPYITLKNGETREFEDKNGKLSKVPSSGASNASTLNTKLKTLKIPNKCWFEEGESEESIECELNQEGLQKIPFSNKAENNDVTVTGLTGNIKLKIEKKQGNNNEIKYTFKDNKTKLTIKGATGKPYITLKENEAREFEDKGGKLGKVSKNSDAKKIKDANQKLETIKIPAWCRFEEEDNETSLECDLSNKEDLKKIEFLNKTSSSKDLTINGSTNGLKLTINRFEGGEGEKKYQTGVDLEFFFSGYSEEIKIQDDSTFNSYSDIALKRNITTLFTISSQSKLAKYFSSSALGGVMGLSCPTSGSPVNCTPVGASTTIKVLNSDGNTREEIKVEDSQKDTQILTATENVDNYEQGIKFSVTNPFPSAAGSSPRLETGDYEAKYVTGKGWGLVKKSQ